MNAGDVTLIVVVFVIAIIVVIGMIRGHKANKIRRSWRR